jgi:drug/metabolite transporter (DMT)-like permease
MIQKIEKYWQLRGNENLLQTHFQLLSVQIFFSFLPVIAKISFRSFSAPTVMFFRIAGTAVCLGIFFFLFRFEKIKSWKHSFFFAGLAFFGVVGNQYLFLKGLSLTNAINASLLIATIPIFTLLIAGILRMERLSWTKLFGVITAFSGIALLINLGNFQWSGYETGSLLIVINAFLYSIYLVLSKPILKQYHPFTVITYIFLFGTIQAIPLTIKDVMAVPYFSLHAEAYLFLFLVVFIGTILPYTINTHALGATRSTLVAIYTYVQPLLGTLLAVIFLKEPLTLRFFLAAALIFSGISLSSYKYNRVKKSLSAEPGN